jgi:hypothetical protein
MNTNLHELLPQTGRNPNHNLFHCRDNPCGCSLLPKLPNLSDYSLSTIDKMHESGSWVAQLPNLSKGIRHCTKKDIMSKQLMISMNLWFCID